MITENWKKIARLNGEVGSLLKLQEECGELDHAIDLFINGDTKETRDLVILECADCLACIDQVLWHLHAEDEVEAAKQWKCIRTVQQMKDSGRWK